MSIIKNIITAVSALSICAAANANWDLHDRTDPFTDEVKVVGANMAPIEGKGVLGFSCNNKKLSVNVMTAGYLNNGDFGDVTFRFDKEKPVTEKWFAHGSMAMSENSALFGMIKDGGHETVVIRATSYDHDSYTARFSLDGAAEVAQAVAEACEAQGEIGRLKDMVDSAN